MWILAFSTPLLYMQMQQSQATFFGDNGDQDSFCKESPYMQITNNANWLAADKLDWTVWLLSHVADIVHDSLWVLTG